MAFNYPKAGEASNTNTGNGQAPARTPKTTLAYVSCFIPLSDGTRVKLFSDLTLRLFAERKAEAKLVELIKSGKITTEQIAKAIQFEISLARDEDQEIEFAFEAEPTINLG